MKLRLFALLLVLFAGSCAILQGQTITVQASATRVAVGEQLQLTYTVKGGASEFEGPDLKDFTLLMNPTQHFSRQMINGVFSQSTSVIYLITPKEEGSFTIGPAKAVIAGGKIIESPEVKIKVKGNLQLQAPQQYGNNSNNYQYNGGSISPPNNLNTNPYGNNNAQSSTVTPQVSASPTKDYFIRYGLSKQRAYVGEQIILAVKLYTRVDVRGPDDFAFPTLEGFWKYDAPKVSQIKRDRESIDGVTYTVYTVFENFLFPQKTGTLRIEPAMLKCRVVKPYEPSGDWWEDFMNSGMGREVPVTLHTQAVEIEVSELPEENKPENFSGAVGEYSMKTEISRDKLKVNDAFNIKITLSGNGNLKLIDPPQLNVPESFESLPPKVTDNIGVTNAGVNGSKIFDYTVIARRDGSDTIPAATFSYFDLGRKDYAVLNTPDFPVTVEPGDPSQAAQVNSFTRQQKAAAKEDIRDIKTGAVQLFSPAPFFGSRAFNLLMLLPPLGFLVFLLLHRRRKKQQEDVAGMKSRQAGKVARRHLHTAETFLHSRNVDLYYNELLRALHGYLSDKLGMQTGELSHESIRSALLGRSAKSETAEAFIQVIEEAEYARYAPAGPAAEMERSYSQALACIDTLEEELK